MMVTNFLPLDSWCKISASCNPSYNNGRSLSVASNQKLLFATLSWPPRASLFKVYDCTLCTVLDANITKCITTQSFSNTSRPGYKKDQNYPPGASIVLVAH